ncbi:hypothetical protein Tco_0682339 [Tanacetum coccineum]|uniref:Uncharacterized protein n=1 Tax=Tanacetum coccineum TaxID=301880 RepID=A0ABQ4XQV4_9ASTR
MLDDDLASLTGFKTPDSADDESKEGTNETFNASTDMPTHPLYLLLFPDYLKENLPGLLLKALKNTFPQLIKDFIKQSVSESIEEKLPSRRFVTLQQELSKVIKTKLECQSDPRNMYKDMVSLLEAAEVFKKANAEWEK